MQYQGGKHRLSKFIAPIINSYIEKNNVKLYYEPFVGSANVVEKIVCERRLASDIDLDMISMLNAMQSGWIPPKSVTEQEYREYNKNRDSISPELRAFVSIGCSFGGKKWGGYARSKARDVTVSSYNSVLAQSRRIDGIEFSCLDYRTLNPVNSVIYCDPPYASTLNYGGVEFDSNEFWMIMKEWGKDNTVFISEYNAPSCSWVRLIKEFDHYKSINNVRTNVPQVKTKERLYIIERGIIS